MSEAIKQLKCKPRGKPWSPGVSGNPTGRAKGALNKFSLAVKGEPLAVNVKAELEQIPTPGPVKYDPRQAHAHTEHKIDGICRRTIEQDGQVFDRETGVLLA